MNNLEHLPPFPAPGASGPEVCEAVRSYLAIVDALSFDEVRILSEHVKGCEECATEFRHLQQATHLLATLPATVPSSRVDDALLEFLRKQAPARNTFIQLHPETRAPAQRKRRVPAYRRRPAVLGLVAVLLLIVTVATGIFVRSLTDSGNAQAFALPEHLSWNGYVLHYTQTRVDAHGKAYQVEVYQDLGTNQMHIESLMQGKFDVVVVTDQQDMLGKDMMHHVAQEGDGVASWAIDGSTFDLAQLRQDLAHQRASYLGLSTFKHQQVYQVRTNSQQVLLLDMHYFPVNVLTMPTGSSPGTPVYTAFELMPTGEVSDSMWDMQVPANFHMGKLPQQS